MGFASSARAAENRTRWKGIVADSSMVLMNVNHSTRSGGIIGIYFRFYIFETILMKTHNIPFSSEIKKKKKKKKKITLNYLKSGAR